MRSAGTSCLLATTVMLVASCDYFPEGLLNTGARQDGAVDGALDQSQRRDGPQPDADALDADRPDANALDFCSHVSTSSRQSGYEARTAMRAGQGQY